MIKTFTTIALSALALSSSAQLWPVQPTLLKDVAPGTTRGTRYLSPYPVNGKLVFSADPSNVGANMLWASDGTTAGTAAVPNVPGKTGNLYPASFFSWQGAQYHLGDYASQSHLYRTSTMGNHDSLSQAVAMDTMDNSVYVLTAAPAAILRFSSNGTAATPISTPAPQLIGTSVMAVGGKVYYPAISAGKGNELWATDIASGTNALVLDINSGTNNSDPEFLGKLGNKLIFSADNGTAGREVWVTDGTAAGTMMLVDAYAGSGSGNGYHYTTWKGKAYFGARVNNGQQEVLWSSDGTPAGTAVVWGRSGSTVVGTVSSVPVNMGDFMIFEGSDTAGRELWRTDGTTAGTTRVKDLIPHRNGMNTGSMFENWLLQTNVIDGRLYFFASDSSLNDQELWTTDGSDTGTHQVCNLNPGISNKRGVSSDALALCKFDGRIYFVGDNGTTGLEVYSFPAPPPASAPPAPTSIAQTPAVPHLQLYPNPANGLVTLPGAQDGDILTLMDASGKTVAQYRVTGGTADVHQLASGTYFCALTANGKMKGCAHLVKY